MAPNDRRHSTDFIRSAPGRGKSWRDWIKRKSPTQNSPVVAEEQQEESKQHGKLQKQQHEAEKQEQQLKLSRTVSFALVAEIFHTLALDDYTQEEISASWFDDDDYYDISYNCRNIISEMNNKSNGSIKRNEECIRGLERMTDIGLALLTCNRNDSYDAVLEEQDIQWDSQEDDHGDRIAQFYREVASRRCHLEAHQRGIQDALVAEELLFLIDEGRKNKDEKEVQTAVCSLGTMMHHDKQKSHPPRL